MKRIVLLLTMAFMLHAAHSQFVYKIKADSVLITNDSCTAELNLENSTKNVKGFLYNKGNGRTEFRKVVKLNDSTIIFGGDTLVIAGSLANLTVSNGITKSGNQIMLGQTIGATGNAADFTSDREIPLASKRLHFKDGRITMKLSTSYQPAIQITDSADNSLLMIRAFSQIDPTNSRVTSIFIGDSAGYKAIAIPGPTTNGVQRIGIGHKALFEDERSNFSTAIGGHAMAAAGYKPWSTALGYSALRSATTGAEDNTALGYVTMYSLQTGKDNIGIGSHNMQRATHIDSSVAVGTWALGSSDAIGGDFRREVAIGMAAGRQTGAFTGSRNVRIGFRAGQDIGTTATGNVLIGHDVARGINVGDNKLYIANTNTSNPLLYGEFDNALLRVGGKLKINNVPDTTSADSILVWTHSDSLVKKIAPSAFGGSFWLLSGNAGTNPTNNFIGTTDNQDFIIRTNATEKVRVATSGKVGIGTANPLYKLDVRGSTDSSYSMIHITRDSVDAGGYIGVSQHPVLLLSADATPNSYNGNWIAKGTTASMMSIAAGNNLNPNVAFFANVGLTPGQSFSPYNMMQLNGGDAYGSMRGVGIGTYVSWHRLHVEHSDSNVLGIRNSASLSATSGAMLRMYNSGTPSAAGQRLGALAWGTGASMTAMRTGARIQSFSEAAWTDNVSQPTYLTFETAPVNANAPVERMRLAADGSFLIGKTTSNGYGKLQVQGSSYITDSLHVGINFNGVRALLLGYPSDVSPGWWCDVGLSTSPIFNNQTSTALAGRGNAGVRTNRRINDMTFGQISPTRPAIHINPGNISGYETHITGKTVIGGDSAIGALIQLIGTTGISDTLKMPNIISKSDTTSYKPVAVDASGNVFKMSSWPVPAKQSFAQTATGTATGTDVETTVIAAGTGSLTIPASSWFAGKSFRIIVQGFYSTDASNPANMIFKIKLGSTVVAQSSTLFLGTGKTDIPYELRAVITCRSTGGSGTVYTMGMFNSDDEVVSKINNGTGATTVNLSSDQTLNITVTPSDNASGNSVSAIIVTFEAIN